MVTTRPCSALKPRRLLSGRCVNAEAATLLTTLGVFGPASSFPDFDATDFDVFSSCAWVFLLLSNATQ